MDDVDNRQMPQSEVTALASAFGNPSQVLENGFVVGGDKFFAIRADDRSLYGRKVCLAALLLRWAVSADNRRARTVSSSSEPSPALSSPITPKPSRPTTPLPWSRTWSTTSTSLSR